MSGWHQVVGLSAWSLQLIGGAVIYNDFTRYTSGKTTTVCTYEEGGGIRLPGDCREAFATCETIEDAQQVAQFILTGEAPLD